MSAPPVEPSVAIPDDHPVWRFIGAWITLRQRGDVGALDGVLTRMPGRRQSARADAQSLLESPLPIEGELEVTATGRIGQRPPWRRTIADLRITIRAEVDSGGQVDAKTHLLALSLVAEEAGSWRLAEVFDEADRAIMRGPAMARLRNSGQESSQ